MSEAEAFVYLWTDSLTNKLYIGVHKGTPEDGYVCSSKDVLKEYNERPQDFTREVLQTGTWRDMLCKEQDLIIEYHAVSSAQYYNKSHGLGPYHGDRTGSKQSSETRAKISASMTPERRAEISAHNKRRITSPETRAKIVAALSGKKRGPYMKRNPPIAGKRRSPEYCAKMSAALTGKRLSPETRAKISASSMGKRLGIPLSPETLAKRAATRAAKIAAAEQIGIPI